jgi:hypothetical protein
VVRKQEVVQLVEDGNANMKFDDIINQILSEKQDRCYHRAVQAYGKKTSAYRSAAMVKCRKGKIWKKK